MTFVIALKVGDGLVLGADSASTISDGTNYHNSYFNAEKLFNLVKGIPIGLVTFGLGGLNGRSISSHAKDLRLDLANPNAPNHLRPDSYTIKEAAEKVRERFYEKLYKQHVQRPSPMGFLVAGYSASGESGEVWKVLVDGNGNCPAPTAVIPQSEPAAAIWEGQPEACSRLLFGYSPMILGRLLAAGLSQQDAMNLLNTAQSVLFPTMPIQDAIDLVDYLVEVTCGFERFAPGHVTVAKPIDTASITRHEGFRWIHRKLYYSQALNLPHPAGP